MKGLLVFLVLASVSASLASECSSLDKIKVKNQWARIHGSPSNRKAFGTAVFKRFFEDHPDRSLFANVNGNDIYSADFQAHVQRVFGGLDILIVSLDQDDLFTAAKSHYSEFHKKLGDVPFAEFGVAFLDTLSDFLPLRDYNQDPWSRCYNYIIS
uniref:Extracellular globin n=1 Tax=Platynereis dumerilii TaxID=6359 RepID=A0A7T8CM05_PLADU|nr:extracellular globin Egb_A1b [Platynereis dumerilii]